MSVVADLLASVFERRYRPSSKTDTDNRRIEDLADTLIGNLGEGSGIEIATKILDRFDQINDDEKRQFFAHLCHNMDIDATTVEATLTAYRRRTSAATYQDFITAVDPDRRKFIRRVNQVPGATEKLVAMRAELLRLKGRDSKLDTLDLDFQSLFAAWFNRGFLVMRPITWETPAHILEKIIAYEAVHAIDSWDALRSRLQPKDRRCFAFFHLSMPDEPLIFVEVALTLDTPRSIDSVLTANRQTLDPQSATTAVFYSISNCQKGLAKISFGNFLIKQVARDLAAELPNLTSFVTLSPIPRLVSWFEKLNLPYKTLGEQTMRELAAYYLINVKHSDGKPFDPVARFHLGNGAEVHAIHANADLSENGLNQSNGLMVNYRYVLDSVAENHERFANDDVVVADDSLHALASRVTDLITQTENKEKAS
jgi:malonyl-CoA decarboxylase